MNPRTALFIVLGIIVLVAMIVVVLTFASSPQPPVNAPTATSEIPGTDIPPLNLVPESTDETIETTPSTS